MRIVKSALPIFVLALSIVALSGWLPEKNSAPISGENTIVLLKFQAQPDKGEQAISELTDLLQKVKKEPNFVSITVHVDPNDVTNILLYEEWEDASYYNNEHMNTAHLQEFMANSSNFLTGPPEITFWEVKSVFE